MVEGANYYAASAVLRGHRERTSISLICGGVTGQYRSMRAPKQTVRNARGLRRKLSVPEARLWNRLRHRAPGQPVFRRQHPIGPYVLDFYCAKARLAVELDGISHDMGNRPARDIRRDAWLAKRGIDVLRVPVGELPRRIEELADALVRMAAGRSVQ